MVSSISIEGEVDGEGEGEVEGEGDGDGEIQHCPFPACQKEFTSRWSLTRHIRTHAGEKPFKCTICGKEFVQKCTLKRHANTHTQEKQWICDHASCGKRFKLKEYLDVHKRTHVKVDAVQSKMKCSYTVRFIKIRYTYYYYGLYIIRCEQQSILLPGMPPLRGSIRTGKSSANNSHKMLSILRYPVTLRTHN
jgi:transcription elongation factor Elf1